jgi:hypothetical protein
MRNRIKPRRPTMAHNPVIPIARPMMAPVPSLDFPPPLEARMGVEDVELPTAWTVVEEVVLIEETGVVVEECVVTTVVEEVAAAAVGEVVVVGVLIGVAQLSHCDNAIGTGVLEVAQFLTSTL